MKHGLRKETRHDPAGPDSRPSGSAPGWPSFGAAVIHPKGLRGPGWRAKASCAAVHRSQSPSERR
jgi:hypothetical protein